MTTVAEPSTAVGIQPEDRTVEELASALDAARASIIGLDPPARKAAEEMAAALDAAHRAALVHIVRGLREDPRGKELLFQLVDDPAIRLVLLMHGIIRADPMTLARQCLADVRPQLQSHGGDVELIRIEDGVAYLRLSGACHGCSMSAVTMRNAVEQALTQRVAGIVGVAVLPNEPGPAFVPLGEVGRRPPGVDRGWCRTRAIDDFGPATITPVTLTPGPAPGEVAGQPVTAEVDAIVVNVGGQLAAYVNECAHLAMPLDDAEIDPQAGTLTCPWHGYRYDALSGECQSLPGTQLEQLPLRVEGGFVWVRTSGY